MVGRGTTATIEIDEVGAVVPYEGRVYTGSKIAKGATGPQCPIINEKDCGFTLVAQESQNAPGKLMHLGQSFGTAGDENFNFGPDLIDQNINYDEVVIKWGTTTYDKFVRFTLNDMKDDICNDKKEDKQIAISKISYDSVTTQQYIESKSSYNWYKNNNGNT